jgi:adenylate kinase family enzyme
MVESIYETDCRPGHKPYFCIMLLHIIGASCSGTTTLGQNLSARLSRPFFDTDDFFWESTDPPFQIKRNPEVRNWLLTNALETHSDSIVSGSLLGWGEEWKPDAAVFLWIPADIRLERLKARELQRYGPEALTAPDRREVFEAFLTWAAQYDDPAFTGRSRRRQEEWLATLGCPVLKILGDTSVAERVERVTAWLTMLSGAPANTLP